MAHSFTSLSTTDRQFDLLGLIIEDFRAAIFDSSSPPKGSSENQGGAEKFRSTNLRASADHGRYGSTRQEPSIRRAERCSSLQWAIVFRRGGLSCPTGLPSVLRISIVAGRNAI